MTKSEINQIWNSVCGRSGNFITPINIGYFEIGDHICEISKGSCDNFSNPFSKACANLHGVTIITKVSGDHYERNSELSQCFDSYAEAVDYINNLYLDTDVEYCNVLDIDEELVLKNGKIIKCIEEYKEDNCEYADAHCNNCYFHNTIVCHKVKCMKNIRTDETDVYFKVIGNEYSIER